MFGLWFINLPVVVLIWIWQVTQDSFFGVLDEKMTPENLPDFGSFARGRIPRILCGFEVAMRVDVVLSCQSCISSKRTGRWQRWCLPWAFSSVDQVPIKVYQSTNCISIPTRYRRRFRKRDPWFEDEYVVNESLARVSECRSACVHHLLFGMSCHCLRPHRSAVAGLCSWSA